MIVGLCVWYREEYAADFLVFIYVLYVYNPIFPSYLSSQIA